MQEISVDKLQTSVWKNFYDLIKANVTSVYIYGSGGAGTKKVDIKSVLSQYADKGLDKSSDYPIIVVNMPTNDFSNLSFREMLVKGDIVFECYATQTETRDKIVEAITYQIMSNRSELMTYKITLSDNPIQDQDSGQYNRGAINVHYGRIRVAYEYNYQ